MISWDLLSDTDDDGVFDDTDILTAQVMGFQMVRGFETAFDRVSPAGVLRVVVHSSNQAFYLERVTHIDLRIGRWMRLRADTNNLFTGVLVAVNRLNRIQVELIIRGRLHNDEQAVMLPLYEDQMVDTILTDVFKKSKISLSEPLNTTGGIPYCIIGTHTIGSCQIADDEITDVSFASSISSIPYFGGVYNTTPSVRQVLEDVVSHEWGYFYEGGDGTLTFSNRYHLINNRTVSLSISEQDQITYEYGAEQVGEVRATVSPRIRQAQTLYTVPVVMRLQRETSLRRFSFYSDDGRVMGVSGDVTVLFTFEDENGQPKTDVDYGIETLGDSFVRIWFTTPLDSERYISIGSTITGIGLIQDNPQEVSVRGSYLQQGIGLRVLDLGALSFSQADECQRMISYVQTQYDQITGYIKSVEIQRNLSVYVGLDVMDIVTLSSSVLNHERDYRIMRIEMNIVGGVGSMTLFIEPVVEDNYIVIGVTGRNLIGTGYIIGY